MARHLLIALLALCCCLAGWQDTTTPPQVRTAVAAALAQGSAVAEAVTDTAPLTRTAGPSDTPAATRVAGPTTTPTLTASPTTSEAGAAPEGQPATVLDVIDGDTIDVSINGATYRVRYIGMIRREEAIRFTLNQLRPTANWFPAGTSSWSRTYQRPTVLVACCAMCTWKTEHS